MVSSGSHVHFDVDRSSVGTDCLSCIKYKRVENSIIVNLGLLKVKHRYKVDLRIPSELFGELTGRTFVSDGPPQRNCNIQEIIGFTHGERDYFEMIIVLFTDKPKHMSINLRLINEKRSTEGLDISLSARVLAMDMSSPTLLEGIHCLGGEFDDDETEAAPMHRPAQ